MIRWLKGVLLLAYREAVYMAGAGDIHTPCLERDARGDVHVPCVRCLPRIRRLQRINRRIYMREIPVARAQLRSR